MLKANKLRFLISFISILLFLSIVSCDGTAPSAARVRVSVISFMQKNNTITNGNTINLSDYLSVYPQDAVNKKVKFEALDANFGTYASLDINTGILVAKSENTTGLRIKATSLDNPSAIDECTIIISPIKVQNVVIYASEDEKSMRVGDTRNLRAKAFPENAKNTTLSYMSNNTDVIEINSTTGQMTAKAIGNATISVLSTDGSNIYDTVEMAVSKKLVPCTDIEFGNDLLTNGYTVAVNGTITLPKVGTNVTLKPTSSDPDGPTTTTEIAIYFTNPAYFSRNDVNGTVKVTKTIPSNTEVYMVVKACDDVGVEKMIRIKTS